MIKMACLEFFFICLVITAFYENSITWDEERPEETAALLEVVGKENWRRLLIFWGMWKFCYIYVCTSNTRRHKAAHWKTSAPGPVCGHHGDEKKFSVKLNCYGHGRWTLGHPNFIVMDCCAHCLSLGTGCCLRYNVFWVTCFTDVVRLRHNQPRNCANTGVSTNLNAQPFAGADDTRLLSWHPPPIQPRLTPQLPPPGL